MKPYFQNEFCTIEHGDCREIFPGIHDEFADMVLCDPPYGETSIGWDKKVSGFIPQLHDIMKATGSLWCFGSMRMFLQMGMESFGGLRFAQDVVWEKHNGSNFHADRFKRVHENVLQFYREPWANVYRNPVKTMDATARTVRRKKRPPHTGHIEAGHYTSQDGGPRLERSVIYVPSCHGYAVHPTQKPAGIIAPLVEYSCPPGGMILDPMMGAGTSLVVAQAMGRHCLGIEMDEKYCEAAAKRMESDEIPLSLFPPNIRREP